MAFGYANRRNDVQLRILTSTQALGEVDGGNEHAASAAKLVEIVNGTFQDHSSMPEIRILGDPPAVHDRFLVVDGDVWLSGNSLNAIGDRAGMIVRLPDPEPVIARLNAFWRAARPLPIDGVTV